MIIYHLRKTASVQQIGRLHVHIKLTIQKLFKPAEDKIMTEKELLDN
jgi:hypothetical protein